MTEVVSAFLEGMYYAGKLPSIAESYDIAKWLVKHQLKGLKPLDVERAVLAQMKALHVRTIPVESA